MQIWNPTVPKITVSERNRKSRTWSATSTTGTSRRRLAPSRTYLWARSNIMERRWAGRRVLNSIRLRTNPSVNLPTADRVNRDKTRVWRIMVESIRTSRRRFWRREALSIRRCRKFRSCSSNKKKRISLWALRSEHWKSIVAAIPKRTSSRQLNPQETRTNGSTNSNGKVGTLRWDSSLNFSTSWRTFSPSTKTLRLQTVVSISLRIQTTANSMIRRAIKSAPGVATSPWTSARQPNLKKTSRSAWKTRQQTWAREIPPKGKWRPQRSLHSLQKSPKSSPSTKSQKLKGHQIRRKRRRKKLIRRTNIAMQIQISRSRAKSSTVIKVIAAIFNWASSWRNWWIRRPYHQIKSSLWRQSSRRRGLLTSRNLRRSSHSPT